MNSIVQQDNANNPIVRMDQNFLYSLYKNYSVMLRKNIIKGNDRFEMQQTFSLIDLGLAEGSVEIDPSTLIEITKDVKKYDQMCKDKVLGLFFTYELEGNKYEDGIMSPKSPSLDRIHSGKELINKQIFIQDEIERYQQIH